VAPNNISVITPVFPYIQKCVSVHMHQGENTTRVRFTGHSRFVETCFTSPFWPRTWRWLLRFSNKMWTLACTTHHIAIPKTHSLYNAETTKPTWPWITRRNTSHYTMEV